MKNEKIKNKISKIPDAPGVYKFLAKNKILYIGKATSLRDRVRSYFNGNIVETRGPLIEKMLEEHDDIKFIKTDSVLEALILEANLIKKHQPPANTAEKDDKSFNYVVITDEKFPRVLVMRGRELEKLSFAASFENHGNFLPARHASQGDAGGLKISSVRRRRSSRGFSQKDGLRFFDFKKTFGPFPNSAQLKEAMKIVRKMFPFRDKCLPAALVKESIPERRVGCFNYQIGLCPGVCTGAISQKEYAKQIKNITLFFEGKKKILIKNLEKQMKDFAKNREFEKANKIKKTIFALGHIQDVALIKNQVSRPRLDTVFRIESYDIAHLSGTNMVGVMIVLENGEIKKSDYRKFKIKENKGADDTKALSEILTRRLAHSEWPMPDLIVVDGGQSQKNVMEKVLVQNNFKIPVVSVVKNEKHKPKEIIGMNNELIIKNYDGGKDKINKYEREILLSNAEAHRFALSFHKLLRSKIF